LKKDWMPVTVYCEKCKKDFTKITNVEGYTIEYECKCGFKDKIDFRKKGIVKLSWRTDWPMRWKYERVDFEPGGIDHSVYGSSFMTAKEIAKKIFGYEPPIYQLYEWIRIKGGKEFSSSAGNVTTLNDVEEIYEPEVLRYLFVGTRPNKGFQISFDNDVIKIYDDYDTLEKKYYDNKANPQEKRIYELSRDKITKERPKKISFRHLITLIQSGKTSKLKKYEKIRAEKVVNWLNKYADEDMKFKVQEKINVKLNEKERKILKELKKSLSKKDYNEEELFNEFYDICGRLKIKNSEFFEAAYKVIINKKKGPRLASLILSVGKKRIIKLLEQIK
jgi:lysyl-tRNA synthetase class 1